MKKTIGDKLINFYINYISPTKEDLEKGNKELKVSQFTSGSSGTKKVGGFLTGELSSSQQRKTAQQAPFLMKGIHKKCMDGTRAWFELETLPDRGKVIKEDLRLIHDFEKRNNFKALWNSLKVNSYIYGDGFGLITFQNDEKTKLWQAPAKNAVPWKVKILNSEKINEINYYPKRKEYFKKQMVMHFHYDDTENRKDFWIHPDRIIHLPRNPLPYKLFGNSIVNLLRNTIKSKVNIDIATGEILSWFSHGVYDIAIPGCEEEDVTYWTKKANEHPGAWIHGDEEKITAVSPTAINPQPFYDYVIMNIAAALIMPTHLLKGIEVGRTTGAEIGFGDYYRDVKDIQELEDTPLIEKLYKTILEKSGKTWKYELNWNPIYIDELAEAEIMKIRVEAAEKALTGGIVDKEEARKIINKGQVKLDETKKIKDKKPLPAPKPPTKPSAEQDLYQYQLDEVTKAMIEKRKKIVAEEKALGEKILKEQDV